MRSCSESGAHVLIHPGLASITALTLRVKLYNQACLRCEALAANISEGDTVTSKLQLRRNMRIENLCLVLQC